MTLDDAISVPAGVVGVLGNGKRRYDPIWKERLIAAALEPGVSIAKLALEHGVNANQLRNWVKLHRDRQGGTGIESSTSLRAVGVRAGGCSCADCASACQHPGSGVCDTIAIEGVAAEWCPA